MNLFALPVEVWITLIVVIFVTGCIAALHSWNRISAEQKRIKDAESKLISDDAWNDAYPHDKLKLATWLRHNGIKPDSHLGDFIRTCWSAWLGGRPASLTELHVLVARRERSHKATRLSAGIAALLLVCGIVGTLSAVKPVLERFQLQVAEDARFQPGVDRQRTGSLSEANEEPDRDAALVAENARKVNTLIQNLGGAFHPSLLALLGTILVVSCRGLYSLSLHRFTLDLDRFAVDTLIPRYRVPSLSEQYQEVKATLTSVTQTLLQREGRFHEAVQQLEGLVASISPALGGLDAAASSTKEAADALSSGATSITEALNRNLGAKSPIHRAVKGLDLVFEKTEKSLGNLSSIVEGIGESNTASQEKLGSAIQALGQAIERIDKDHQSRQSEAAKVLTDFKETLDGIPDVIQGTGEKAVEVGLTAVRTSLAELRGAQLKSHAATAEEFKAASAVSLAGVTRAGQDLAAQAGNIATAAKDIQRVKEDVSATLKELTAAGKSQILQIGNDTKREVATATAELSVEAKRIIECADQMKKAERGPSPPAVPRKWAPIITNAPTRSNLGDSQTLLAGKVPPPTTTPVSQKQEPSSDLVPAPGGNQETEEPLTEDVEPPNSYDSPQETPKERALPTAQPTGTLVGSAGDRGPQPRRKWWSVISKPFLGRNR